MYKVKKFNLIEWLKAIAIMLIMMITLSGCVGKKNDSAEAESENNLFIHGLVAVMNDDGKWGYINEQGEMVIEPQFDQAHGFTPNGLARVGIQDSCVSRMYGYINEKGELVQDVQFFIASNFDENGLAVVSRGEIFKTDYYKMALIDSEGNFVYDGNCRSFTKFVNGYAWVAKKNKSVKIDLEGNEQMTVDGCAVAQFDDGYTIVEKGEKRYCIINTEGQQIGAEYAEIYRTTEGFERDAEHEYLDGYCW